MLSISQEKKREGLSLLLCTVCLCIPAFYNNFPFIYSDTGTYILAGFFSDYVSDIRPITYGLFLRHLTLLESFWFVVYVQAFLVAWFIRLFGKTFFPRRSALLDLLVVAMLTAGTTIGITTGLLMPDFSTPLLLLATAVLLYKGQTNIGNLIAAGLMIWFATAAHHSHAYILFFLLLGVLFYKLTFRSAADWIGGKRIAASFVLVVLGYLTIPTLHFSRSGEFVSSKSTYVFLTSRIDQMGLLEPFLAEYCPTKDYSICNYRDNIPRDFLWNKDSPVYRDGGWAANNERYRELVHDFFRDFKFLKKFVIKAVGTGLQQVFNFNAVYLHPLQRGEWPQNTFEYHMPDVVPALELSLQNKNVWNSNTSYINRRQQWVVYGSSLVLIYLLGFQNRWSISPLHRGVGLLLLIGLLGNAFICSGVSMLDHRFQSRVIWLVPLFTIYLLHHLWWQNQGGDKSGEAD